MSTIAPPRPRRRRRGGAPTPTRPAPLVTYTDDFGIRRELVCVAGAGATRLVIDRLLDGAGDRRLVAHLAADEPPQNAAHVAGAYLSHIDALRLFARARHAMLSQLPLLGLMVLFTTIGLWILSLPLASR